MHLDLIVGGVENLFKSSNTHMQILPSVRGRTSVEISSVGGEWSKTCQYFTICWGTNTFKNHDLHEKTTKRKTCSSCRSNCCFPNVLKNVSTNINRNSYDENTLELRSSKVDECSVREWIKVEEHGQFESCQFRCKLCSAYGYAFA